MIWTEALRQVWRTMRSQLMRTLLTLFGVLWGTAAAIFLASWGEGVRLMLDSAMSKTGKNMIMVWAGKIGEDFTPAIDRRNLWLTLRDVDHLRRRARTPDLISAEIQMWRVVGHGRKALSLDVRGVDAGALAIRGVEIAAGRALSRSDLAQARRVAVIGPKARERLIDADEPLGRIVSIGGFPFEIVGVMAPVGFQLNRDGDEIEAQIWIPIGAALHLGHEFQVEEDVIGRVLVRVPDRELLDSAEAEVRGILSERLGTNPLDTEAVGTFIPGKFLDRFDIGQSDRVMLMIALATLVIGGVGVMNLMIDAVQERRVEIGVRLAVGARRRDVLMQFALEAFALTLVGGLAGLGVGVIGCSFLASLHVPDMIPLPVLQWDVVGLAFLVMIGVGAAAGVLPAWQAAQVDPGLTLRME